jgi:hypothetical protein
MADKVFYVEAAQVAGKGFGAIGIGPQPTPEETLKAAVAACERVREYLQKQFVRRGDIVVADANGSGGAIVTARLQTCINESVRALRDVFRLESEPDAPIDNILLAYLPPEPTVAAKEMVAILNAMKAAPIPGHLVESFERVLNRLPGSSPGGIIPTVNDEQTQSEPLDNLRTLLPVPTDPNEYDLWGRLTNNAAAGCPRNDIDIAREFFANDVERGEKLYDSIRAKVKRKTLRDWK